MLSTFQKNSTYIPQNRCVSRVQIMLNTVWFHVFAHLVYNYYKWKLGKVIIEMIW